MINGASTGSLSSVWGEITVGDRRAIVVFGKIGTIDSIPLPQVANKLELEPSRPSIVN